MLGHKNPKITFEKYAKYIPTISIKGIIFDKLALRIGTFLAQFWNNVVFKSFEILYFREF